MEAWIAAFSRIAREGGMRPAAARQAAEEAIVRIEDSLVLARVLDNPAPFHRA